LRQGCGAVSRNPRCALLAASRKASMQRATGGLRLTRPLPAGYRDRMPQAFARRTTEMRAFLAMDVMERAIEMERAGADVIHLEIGEPDFPAHPAAAPACIRAIESGWTHYTDSRGLSELREAIAVDHWRRFGVAVEAERIIVGNGTSPAMLLVFSLLVGEGDEVVLATPC
jgi:aspartate/methionine/tyrosine aminotransferase